MQHKISQAGLDFIKSFESFVPYVYDDLVAPVRGHYAEWDGSKPRGTLTIGYGHTNAAKHPLKIRQGLRITESEAQEILDVDLDECEDAVNSLVKVELTQGMFDALVSFTFNCGTGNLKRLIVPLNLGNYGPTRAAFDSYVNSKGKRLAGLQRRRDGEQALWDEGNANLPTVVVDHPAEVDAPKKPNPVLTFFGSRTIRAGLAGLGAIWAAFHGWWNSVLGTFSIPPADDIAGFVTDAHQNIDQTKQLASLFSIDANDAAAALIIAAVVIGYMIARRFFDKREQPQ